jgi:hypothetical protein
MTFNLNKLTKKKKIKKKSLIILFDLLCIFLISDSIQINLENLSILLDYVQMYRSISIEFVRMLNISKHPTNKLLEKKKELLFVLIILILFEIIPNLQSNSLLDNTYPNFFQQFLEYSMYKTY